jgi:hypothetical protein
MDELPKRRGRGPGWNQEFIDHARDRRRLRDSIGEIERSLNARFGVSVPVSTIKSWVVDTQRDASGEWGLWHELPVDPDPAVVLPVLAAVSWSTDGRINAFTKDEARWVTLLSRVRPDLQYNLYTAARAFIEAAQADDDNELRRQQALIAVGAARLKWPDLEGQIVNLREIGQRTKAELAAGLNPFLDGRPYRPEDKP